LQTISLRLQAITLRLQARVLPFQAITLRLQARGLPLQTSALRLQKTLPPAAIRPPESQPGVRVGISTGEERVRIVVGTR
jgi:hypothetical protein